MPYGWATQVQPTDECHPAEWAGGGKGGGCCGERPNTFWCITEPNHPRPTSQLSASHLFTLSSSINKALCRQSTYSCRLFFFFCCCLSGKVPGGTLKRGKPSEKTRTRVFRETSRKRLMRSDGTCLRKGGQGVMQLERKPAYRFPAFNSVFVSSPTPRSSARCEKRNKRGKDERSKCGGRPRFSQDAWEGAIIVVPRMRSRADSTWQTPPR